MMDSYANLAKVPYDILRHLVFLLSQGDVSRLARTCHDLHDSLELELLRNSKVDDDHLGNFCRWLGLSGEEDVGNRALRLHVLTINNLGTGPNVFGVTSGYLRELLSCSRNLKSLTLHGLIEYVITPGQLRSALQALPSLEYIDLANITAQYKDIFADALCAPRSVSLSFVPNPHHHPRLTKEILVDIFPFLCHPSLQGIESLTIKAARLDAYSVSFPALRRLEADSCWLREVHADALAGSFPSHYYCTRCRDWDASQ
ncbi:hypothetical protein BD309DRAFT_236965 [Dichomitus squalens]|nr:hypothetical protein BD309DRAFT_236965 [Dichomitus squalens]